MELDVQIPLWVTGATGFTGSLFLGHLEKSHPGMAVDCLVRSTSDRAPLEGLALNLKYTIGDSARRPTWDAWLAERTPHTIVHIASIRHTPAMLDSLRAAGQTPRLIVVGTTGVYSQYNQYAQIYQQIEQQLAQYAGSYCLLRPTMIYGSHRDKNLHKLLVFCDRTSFFPVFGTGNCLLQPIHADDLAQAILATVQRPKIEGAYDLSGGSIVTFRELLSLVGSLLNKTIYPIPIPITAGVWLATALEGGLGQRSPVRREQILRLQEDKAYPHAQAQRDLNFSPRSLEVGLKQEVELLCSQGILANQAADL